MDDDVIYHPKYDDQGDIDEIVLTEAAESILKQSYYKTNQYFPPVIDTIDENDAQLPIRP